MDWLEILRDVVVVVLLLAILTVVLQLKNLLKHMMSTLRRDVESVKKEIEADLQEVRLDNKGTHGEMLRALGSMRKSILDDLDAIRKSVKEISESENRDSRTRPSRKEDKAQLDE